MSTAFAYHFSISVFIWDTYSIFMVIAVTISMCHYSQCLEENVNDLGGRLLRLTLAGAWNVRPKMSQVS